MLLQLLVLTQAYTPACDVNRIRRGSVLGVVDAFGGDGSDVDEALVVGAHAVLF